MLTANVTRKGVQGVPGTIKFLERRSADFLKYSTAIGTQTDPVVIKNGPKKTNKKTARKTAKKTLKPNQGKRRVKRRNSAASTGLKMKQLTSPKGGATVPNTTQKPASRRHDRRVTGSTNGKGRVGHSVRSLRIHREVLLKNEEIGQSIPRVLCQTVRTRRACRQPKWSKFAAWSRHATSGLAIPVFFMTR